MNDAAREVRVGVAPKDFDLRRVSLRAVAGHGERERERKRVSAVIIRHNCLAATVMASVAAGIAARATAATVPSEIALAPRPSVPAP